MPYSSEAKIKAKSKFGVLGWKSNSIELELIDVIVTPDCDSKFDSKSESPVQDKDPSLKTTLFGDGVLLMSPVVKTTPFSKGKFGLSFSKYPTPFVDPKSVPVLTTTFAPDTHGELIKTLLTNSSAV